MKLAVIVAVSKYAGSGLSDLPGCVQDANLVQTILEGQDGYREVLTLTTNTKSIAVKQHLTDFVKKYKGQTISDFVFYFTGHGAFITNEYYYLFSDYHSTRIRQTALENTELDNLIRGLKPALTTKIVDACQSGLPYIKDRGEIDLYLKGTQSEFQNCYFLFSSHTDESSYQDNVLSAFTRSIGELVASRTGVIRHKDIIDYVSDSFALNSVQTPFFVAQADFTDEFCRVDPQLRKKVVHLLASAASPSVESVVSPSGPTTLKALVEADAQYYCTREEASAALTDFAARLETCKQPAEMQDLYTLEVSELSDYSGIPNVIAIGKWLQENKHSFFAEPTFEKVKVKKPILSPPRTPTVVAGYDWRSQLGEGLYDFVYETRISGVRSTTEMPYAGLLVRAVALYPNLNSSRLLPGAIRL